MSLASFLYLGITFGLFVIFAAIVIQTYRRKNKKRLEEPKQRMLEDD